jgi:hypothetical protein
MGFWNNVADSVREWMWQPMYERMGLVGEERQRVERMKEHKQYLDGNQPQQIQVKAGKANDNIVINILDKVVRKSAAMLFGQGVSFDLGEGEEYDEAEAYLNEVWEANRKGIFLKNLGRTGGGYGTVYVKLVPDGEGDTRIVSLPPANMRVITAEGDPETVEEYHQYWVVMVDRKEKVRRERTFIERTQKDGVVTEKWRVVVEQEQGKRWEQIEAVDWDYDFPPIAHCQNLPRDFSPYGASDIEGLIGLQNRVNFVAGNISKIIRYHAHPKTIGTGISRAVKRLVSGEGDEAAPVAEMSGDQMWTHPDPNVKVYNLEMQSDLASSMNYLQFLIQTVYDLGQTVNTANVKDKLGQLTNFAIRVLYQDALEKLDDKRTLYGELLTEINRRLLVLKDEAWAEFGGGIVVWPNDVVPTNSKELAEELRSDVDAGFVSKQTAAGLRGYDWEQEQVRMQEEATEQQGELGARLIAAFNQGA